MRFGFGFGCIVFTMFSIQHISFYFCTQLHTYTPIDAMRSEKTTEVNSSACKFEHVEFGVDNEL